jgi:hypothetical protein
MSALHFHGLDHAIGLHDRFRLHIPLQIHGAGNLRILRRDSIHNLTIALRLLLLTERASNQN